LILTYEWGFLLKETGDLLGVSESRASQVLAAALQRQKTLISSEGSRITTVKGQRVQQSPVSQEIQKRPSLYQKAIRIMETMGGEANQRVGTRSVSEVSQGLLGTFGCSAF